MLYRVTKEDLLRVFNKYFTAFLTPGSRIISICAGTSGTEELQKELKESAFKVDAEVMSFADVSGLVQLST